MSDFTQKAEASLNDDTKAALTAFLSHSDLEKKWFLHAELRDSRSPESLFGSLKECTPLLSQDGTSNFKRMPSIETLDNDLRVEILKFNQKHKN